MDNKKETKPAVWRWTGRVVEENNSLGIPVPKAQMMIVPAGQESQADSLSRAFKANAAPKNSIVRNFSFEQLEENAKKMAVVPEQEKNLEQVLHARHKLVELREAAAAPKKKAAASTGSRPQAGVFN